MAFTCTPIEPPCVASKRLDTNSNSAIASLLYFGWPKPLVWFWVTRKPSTFNWKVPTPTVPTSVPGSSVDAFRRLPGASIARSTQLRPFTGRSLTCRESMALPTEDVVVSTSGAWPLTVTDSSRPAADICRFTTAVCPTSSDVERVTVENPDRSADTR